MKIGIIVPSIGSFGKRGFYNLQEVGLAKALDRYFDQVIVWRLVEHGSNHIIEKIPGTRNAEISFLPAWKLGSNGIVDCSQIDKDINILLCFADTQLSVPSIKKWAEKNGIAFIPYIGVTKSHSVSVIKRITMDTMFYRNLTVYKKCSCIVKTPQVKSELSELGVKNIAVTPVGLDLDLLEHDYKQISIQQKKEEYGYAVEDKVILFIGRLTEEKQPLKLLEILKKIRMYDDRYKLLMVGKGELQENVKKKIDSQALTPYVRLIDQIPNNEVWELYRIADVFVNLNQQEIFGMAILEAMYYGCKVVAWHAPGPDFIIEHGVSGYLEDSDEGIIHSICNGSIDPQKARERILNHFTWDITARKIMDVIEQSKEKLCVDLRI